MWTTVHLIMYAIILIHKFKLNNNFEQNIISVSNCTVNKDKCTLEVKIILLKKKKLINLYSTKQRHYNNIIL